MRMVFAMPRRLPKALAALLLAASLLPAGGLAYAVGESASVAGAPSGAANGLEVADGQVGADSSGGQVDAADGTVEDAADEAASDEMPAASALDASNAVEDAANPGADLEKQGTVSAQADDLLVGATSMPSLVTLTSALDSSYALDIPAASTSDGAAVQLYGDNNTPAQRYRLKDLGSGYYALINVHSGKALDVRNGIAKRGAVVQQYTPNGTDAQAWKFVTSADGSSYAIVSKLSDDFALDVQWGSAANGTPVRLYDVNGTASQKFSVTSYVRTVEDGTYTVKSLGTGAMLDVAGCSGADGANVQMYQANGTTAQNFTFSYDDTTGYYTIATFATGKVLDVAAAGMTSGSNVQQYGSNGTAAQKWTVEPVASGGWVIRSGCSGLVLDVAAASRQNGANVQTYQENGTLAQRWELGKAPSLSLSGLFTFASAKNGGFVLDVAAGGMENGTNVQIYSSNSSSAQKFEVEMKDSGYCVIRSLKSGKVLDVAGAGKANGTNVQIYEENGSDAQLWKPVQYDSSTYGFQSKCNGLFLDVSAGVMADGANVQVWQDNGSAAQRFELRSTDRSDAVTEGSYVVTSVADGTALDVLGAGTANGTRAQLYAQNGSYAQKFKVLKLGTNRYGLANVHSSKYFDVDTGSGSILQQWDRTAAANQTWVFSPVQGASGAYYIQSAYTGTYLTNDGGALTLASYTGSVAQQFRLERTQAFKVYLDAGHGYNSNGDGGVDSGAVSLGYRECDLTQDLVSRIASNLDALGIEYYIGSGMAYWDRQWDAQVKGCSTFLSIHFNAGGGWGVESYIHSYNAAPGASTYQQIMHPYLVQGTSLVNRGLKDAELAVCGGRLPSVLLEVAFIDNVGDMTTYMNRRDEVARQLAYGLRQASGNSACGWYYG